LALGALAHHAITVLSVEAAKGLEFDVVYALPDGMSKNEQYIAFTRALSELIIVR
jgi:DNA helicase IV